MEWIKELEEHKELLQELSAFLNEYGFFGLRSAIQQYAAKQHSYTYNYKGAICKINISDIYFLKISGHNITIHTSHGIYKKYGSLKHELPILTPYGFVQCSQSCLVSLHKITAIRRNNIILDDNTQLHLSRQFVPKVLLEYSLKK